MGAKQTLVCGAVVRRWPERGVAAPRRSAARRAQDSLAGRPRLDGGHCADASQEGRIRHGRERLHAGAQDLALLGRPTQLGCTQLQLLEDAVFRSWEW